MYITIACTFCRYYMTLEQRRKEGERSLGGPVGPGVGAAGGAGAAAGGGRPPPQPAHKPPTTKDIKEDKPKDEPKVFLYFMLRLSNNWIVYLTPNGAKYVPNSTQRKQCSQWHPMNTLYTCPMAPTTEHKYMPNGRL